MSEIKRSVDQLLTRRKSKPKRTSENEGRQGQVLSLLMIYGSITTRELCAALRISVSNASVLLYTMYRRGQLERTGERRAYRYTLP